MSQTLPNICFAEYWLIDNRLIQETVERLKFKERRIYKKLCKVRTNSWSIFIIVVQEFQKVFWIYKINFLNWLVFKLMNLSYYHHFLTEFSWNNRFSCLRRLLKRSQSMYNQPFPYFGLFHYFQTTFNSKTSKRLFTSVFALAFPSKIRQPWLG